MSRRKRASGGQAIVMVTLALFSMVGMMGLAVDLGWSYFAQKQAQAAADTAALGAAQEAITRLGTSSQVSGFSCGSTLEGTGASDVECTEFSSAAVLESCGSLTSTSNLDNACLYAKRNGFQYDIAGSNQSVSVQSGDVLDANRPPNVNRISYWVRVRTVQYIPQLFSVMEGNKLGTVAANATAGIAGEIAPGSFYGMNQAGDCLTGTDAGNCGLDFLTGHGKGKGSGGSQACGNTTSDLCAPAGAILASSCNDSSSKASGCDQAAGIENGAGLAARSVVIMGPAGAVDGTVKDLNGNTLTPTNTTNASTFQDPTAPNSQPPLATPATNIGTCGIPRSNGGTVTLTGNVGPYLYYTYSSIVGGKPVPDGLPLTISGTATFSQGAGSAGASAPCPSVSVAGLGSTFATAGQGQTYANFPTYIFLGGLVNNGTMTLGPGQYVMAGTNSTTGYVLDNEGTIDGTSSAAQATGTMFIYTDAAYPGMNLTGSTAPANFTNLVSGPTGTALYQGSIALNGNTTMYGLVNSSVGGSNLPAYLNVDTGIVFWQDRRNSNVGYDEAAGSPGCDSYCTGDNGSVISCALTCKDGSKSTPNVLATANHVTANSPGVQWGNGNGKIALTGVYYQPRGAWIHLGNGNTGFNCPANGGQCPMQLITGSVLMDSGNTRVVLAGPSNPLITYRAVLIQ